MRLIKRLQSGVAAAPLLAFALCPLIAAPPACAAPILPTGGKVVAGSATIATPKGGALVIDQTSSRAIIDWSSFSIGAAGAVKFDNGSGATLNRVTGDSGSLISGLLSGTGSVYLINSRGVIIGKHGVVNVGGTFAASTLDVANSQFLAGGSLTFSGPSTAAVVNYGRIGALGGDVALIAATVDNAGSITAANGTAGLAAGYRVILRDRSLDNGKFAVLLGGSNTSVTNAGVIAAADAELRANGGNIYALAGNTAGIISATGVKTGQGKVWLVAEGGTLDVAGTISAQGVKGSTGAIETSGQSVSLGKAAIDAHGGSWLLDPTNLEITKAAATSISTALATSDVTEETTATGSSQTPGVVSSSGVGNITLDTGATIAWTSSHALTLQAYNNVDLKGTISLASGTLNLTAGGSVVIDAPVHITGAGAVDITAGSRTVDGQSLADLAFGAGDSIDYGATDNGGALSINGQAYSLIYGLTHDVGGSVALATNITAPATAFEGPIYGLDSGNTFEGLGHTITGLKINGVSGATEIGFFFGNSGVIRDLGLVGGTVTGGSVTSTEVGSIAAVNTGVIDNVYDTGAVVGGNTQNVGGLVGINSGAILNSYSTGAVSGKSSPNVGGLVGMNSGTIANAYATGDVDGGGPAVGGLVGTNTGTISGAYATGAVSGADTNINSVGGLVGSNSGLVTGSYAAGVVTGLSHSSVGGLVGLNSGTVSVSYASGATNDGLNVGGLVGNNTGEIEFDYATGAASGGIGTGGLVGVNYTLGSIKYSFATGSVTGSRAAAGGLVGVDDGGTIFAAYATGQVSGGQPNGGLTGINGDGSTVTSGYYDAGTTGQPLGTQPDGSVGLSTPALQASLPAGFSPSIWGQIAGVSYPYLLSFYPAGSTPQVVAGAARATTTGGVLAAPIGGATVDAVLNGSTLLGATTTGANGYYYFLLAPGTLSSGSTLLTYLAGGSTHADAVVEDLTGANIKGLALFQDALAIQTPDTSLSATETGLASALGSATSGAGADIIFGVSGGSLSLGSNDSLEIAASGASFGVDAGLSLGTGLFKLTAAGSVTQTAGAIVAGALQGSSIGGASFTDAGNQITQLTGWSDPTGAFTLANAGALSVAGEVTAATGIDLTTTAGALNLSRGLISTSGGVILDAAGAVTEAAGLATISADGQLTVTSEGGASLLAANKVGTLSLQNTGGGAVKYKEAGALNVAAASNAGGGTLSLTNTSGDLTFAGLVSGGAITLTSAGGITETGAGAIDATTLVGTAGGAVALNGQNAVSTLEKFTTTGGGFTLVDDRALLQTSTLSAGGNAVSLSTTAGNIEIAGTVDASTLTLDAAAGALTESTALGAIKVGTLNATAAKGITLTSTRNDIGTIGTDDPGSGPNKITQ